MDLRFSGVLTKAEYLALVKLSNRRILKKGGVYFDFWMLLIGIGIFFLLLAAVTIQQWNLSRAGSLPWSIVELVVGIVVISLGFKTRAFPSKFWDENKDSLSRVDGRISDEFIELFIPNGNLKVNWSELDGYGEYQGLIVLYKPPLTVLPCVERFFEKQEDWILFRHAVADKLPLSHRVGQFDAPKAGTVWVWVLFIVSIIIMLFYYFARGG